MYSVKAMRSSAASCRRISSLAASTFFDDAKQLVRDAIAAGIFNDLFSGSNVDLCVITRDGATYIRPYDVANVKGKR